MERKFAGHRFHFPHEMEKVNTVDSLRMIVETLPDLGYFTQMCEFRSWSSKLQVRSQIKERIGSWLLRTDLWLPRGRGLGRDGVGGWG